MIRKIRRLASFNEKLADLLVFVLQVLLVFVVKTFTFASFEVKTLRFDSFVEKLANFLVFWSKKTRRFISF